MPLLSFSIYEEFSLSGNPNIHSPAPSPREKKINSIRESSHKNDAVTMIAATAFRETRGPDRNTKHPQSTRGTENPLKKEHLLENSLPARFQKFLLSEPTRITLYDILRLMSRNWLVKENSLSVITGARTPFPEEDIFPASLPRP